VITTTIDTLLDNDVVKRHAALEGCIRLADHERFTLSADMAAFARKTADTLAAADENGAPTTDLSKMLGRATLALSMLRGEVARNCLLRIADERSYAVKSALARALRETKTAEGRSVLVYLLSDDDAQADALVAIGASPWPEILPALIEIAESDDRAARLAARAIARCGANAGPNEAAAAASFLLEQLDDESVVFAAADAIVRFGARLPGVAKKARQLAAQDGNRRIAGLSIIAATGEPDLASIAGRAREITDQNAHVFLRSLREDRNPAVQEAGVRTARALGLP
jgi:hypothetical protein